MRNIYFFNNNFGLEQVGGKGLSLIKMTQAGLPVPPGFILATDFFLPWEEELKSLAEWKKTDLRKNLSELIDALKKASQNLKLTKDQKEELNKALSDFPEAKDMLFSVRSSSPEEDLAGASFAGIYETVLGVNLENIEKAILTVFQSQLDLRAFEYKYHHGFDITKLKIAVIIQTQIASESAGVGFSINPLNNCYDEVVINANWGLGESIVSGDVTPDTYLINKYTNEIISKEVGSKTQSYFLTKNGIETKQNKNPKDFVLSEDKILELKELILKVEKYYQMPMDTEWAFYKDTLFLLQARPITTYLPLPPKILTKPGEKPQLYLDLTLVEQGIQGALSPIGISWFGGITETMIFEATNIPDLGCDLKDGLADSVGGRTYLSISNLLWLMKAKALAGEFASLDTYAARILEQINEKDYKSIKKPSTFKGIIWKSLYHTGGLMKDTMVGIIFPQKLNAKYERGVKQYLADVEALKKEKLDILSLYEKTVKLGVDLMMKITLPTLMDAEMAKAELKSMFKKDPQEIQDLVDCLDRALPRNVTTEMGLAIYHMARQIKPQEYQDLDKLAKKIEAKDMPKEFLADWQNFMAKFGFRGPKEIDVLSERYMDNPIILLNQMANFAEIKDDKLNPQAQFEIKAKERKDAYEKLLEYTKKHLIKNKIFKKMYKILEEFGGLREVHKYYLVMINHYLRIKLLEEGAKLVKLGRLDKPEDIFYLYINELREGLEHQATNLKALAKVNKEFSDRLMQVPSFPPLVDSRGRILAPPKRKAGPGELIGDPVSNGVIKGPVKILHTSDEKKVEPGDILVIRSADPGWTPLFITAGAVILEVGGMLQHGSIIAREYGKPCIAGIDGVMDKLKDGQMVEVNGQEGIVKIL